MTIQKRIAVLGAGQIGVIIAGMLAERWLFFAEARHAVASFYGIGQADGDVAFL